MTRWRDVTLPVAPGMIHYPGNPPVRIEPHSEIRHGASANVSLLSFGSHTGTHVDAPRHFDDDAAGVDALPLDVLIGPAVVLEIAAGVRAVGAAELARHDLLGRSRVLLKTGNSQLDPRGDFERDYAYLAPDGAEWLVERGVRLVGTDYLSIEQFRSGHHRTHRTLFAAGVVIVEGLALGGVRAGPCGLICLPLRLEGLDGAPARVVLEEE